MLTIPASLDAGDKPPSLYSLTVTIVWTKELETSILVLPGKSSAGFSVLDK
jgi:hypothetical protein